MGEDPHPPRTAQPRAARTYLAGEGGDLVNVAHDAGDGLGRDYGRLAGEQRRLVQRLDERERLQELALGVPDLQDDGPPPLFDGELALGGRERLAGRAVVPRRRGADLGQLGERLEQHRRGVERRHGCCGRRASGARARQRWPRRRWRRRWRA